MIVIGIDPHKSSLTAAALEADGTTSACRRFAVNKGTGSAVLTWASQFEEVRFAVEGARGLGRGIPSSCSIRAMKSSTCLPRCR